MPTIHDVARAAGVGIGTVSRVLNGSRLVTPATRRRVQEAIERLGYEPSPVARAFGRRRTQKLDVIVPQVAQPFILEIFRGIEQALADTGYTLQVYTVLDSEDRERVFEHCCRRARTDGVLLVWMPPTQSLVEETRGNEVPMVLLNSSYPGICSIAVDHDAAAATAVSYCIGLGHRRIGLIDRRLDPFVGEGAGICQTGYRSALDAAGLERSTEYERVVALNPRSGSAAMDALLMLAAPPTAVLVGSDMQAVGALQAARRRGRSIPEQLSLVGYNDNDVAAFFGLTTVSLPLRELASQATEHLLTMLADPHTDACTTLLPTSLTVRRTCGPPAAA